MDHSLSTRPQITLFVNGVFLENVTEDKQQLKYF